MITAEIIKDSINPVGKRITSFCLTYPRFILAEINTHRIFSRSSASSRAIPVDKFIKDLIANPVIPIYWGENKKGMQAGDEIPEVDKAISIWLDGMKSAIKTAEALRDLGVHKQTANRVLEPYYHMRTLLTATEFDNFFLQRESPLAQPELGELALQMHKALYQSKPVLTPSGEFHLPYIIPIERERYAISDLIKISSARCARVSYMTHGGTINPIKDIQLYDKLSTANPPHFSPLEHVAISTYTDNDYFNLKGWKSFRYLLQER